jgi:hypothetical protein
MDRIEFAMWGLRIKAAGTVAVLGAILLATLVLIGIWLNAP